MDGVCVVSNFYFGGLTFDFFSNNRENFRNKNPRPMDYSAGAGNGPFGVNTELCDFGGPPPPLSRCSGFVSGAGGFFPQKKRRSPADAAGFRRPNALLGRGRALRLF